MNASETKPKEARPRRRRRAVLLLVGSLAILLSAQFFWRRDARVELPEIDTTGLASRVGQDIEAARQRIAESPQSADAWGELGMILVAHQLEPQAHACFERARELDPTKFDWPYLLGVSLAVSDPPRAVENLNAAVSLRDDVAVAHVRLGELLLELNQLDKARTHLETALSQAPDDLHTLIALVRLELARDDIASAQQFAGKLESLGPRVRAVHEVRARLFQRKGDRPAAMHELQLADKLPDVPLPYEDPYAMRVLALRRDHQQGLDEARELLAGQRFNEAIDVLRQAWREHPSDPILPCELARALAQVNNFDMAHAVLQQAADQHPYSAQVRLQRGVLYFLQAEHEEAARCFREATDRKPDYVLANYYLGKCFEELDRTSDAVSAFRITVRLQPTHAAAHADLGRLLLEQGHNNAAAEHLTTALQLAPDDAAIQALHARAIAASDSAAASPNETEAPAPSAPK